jgi:Bacterial regulatory proteins, gntR family
VTVRLWVHSGSTSYSTTLDHYRVLTTLRDHGREWTGTFPHVAEDPRAYVRIAALVRAQIESGQLAPGQPVPSITTLVQEHGVARQTAAKGLRLLESEGLLYRVPGLGYYVTDPKSGN